MAPGQPEAGDQAIAIVDPIDRQDPIQELAEAGIHIVDFADLDESQRAALATYYETSVFPVLTPLAVDPSHPFPYISDLSLSLAVTVRDPASGERRFARVKVPPVLPRLWEVAPRTYVQLERIIAANLNRCKNGVFVQLCIQIDCNIACIGGDGFLSLLAGKKLGQYILNGGRRRNR